MNQNIINDISSELNIGNNQVESVLKLLSEDNTVPFIARYRKEATGNLDEEQIRKINEVYEYEVNLLKRKEDVIRLIDEKGLLTDDIKNNIMNAKKLVEVEDIYLPYKEKKKTKATEAIKNGLEPLAKIIMSFPKELNNIEKYLNENIKTKEEAINGASYIIAEWISDNASYRKWIRSFIWKNGIITSKLKKNAEDVNKTYEMYYDFNEQAKYIKPHRVLAINRGENEKVLNVKIEYNNEEIIDYLKSKLIKDSSSPSLIIVENSIKDSLTRLVLPSLDREIRNDLTDQSEDKAIDVFKDNLEHLLLIPPMKEKIVLGFDPAYRTGCKLAVVDSTSKVLKITVIYPHEPKNEWNKSKEILKDLITKYNVNIVSIGNGTASRESEKLVSETLNELNNGCKYAIVSEAGASVYSASKLAIGEFPTLHVEERSAISIARRLQDPLNELVKIEPKAIGVGQYQHDVSPKKLTDSLDFTVTKCVNNVGVNINTASASILKYISGLTKSTIDKIIKYRETKGKILSREEIKTKKLLNDKSFEQSIGFMRIIDGNNPLDKTNIHTESYEKTIKLLNSISKTVNDIGSKELIDKLATIDTQKTAKELNIDIYTLNDIISSLSAPNRDYRDNYDMPLLKSNILTIDNLSIGMKLEGTVRNVVDFGAFIDIGLHDDALVHISKITNKYIKHPSEVLSVGDIITCYILDINKDKNKVSLTLLDPK